MTCMIASNLDFICWCTCNNCNDQHLIGSLEFRCCQEVEEDVGKYTSAGLKAQCITTHDLDHDFAPKDCIGTSWPTSE